MHTAFRHLAKRVGEAQEALTAVLREIEPSDFLHP